MQIKLQDFDHVTAKKEQWGQSSGLRGILVRRKNSHNKSSGQLSVAQI